MWLQLLGSSATWGVVSTAGAGGGGVGVRVKPLSAVQGWLLPTDGARTVLPACAGSNS
jgi:hypothetical protein